MNQPLERAKLKLSFVRFYLRWQHKRITRAKRNKAAQCSASTLWSRARKTVKISFESGNTLATIMTKLDP
jgi:hypothetical protein